MINNQMRSLLKLDSEERLSLETIGERIFNKQNLLDKLIQKQESGHCIRETESSALLINYTFVPSKGIIFTASDITESKELQKSIKKRISYLETLNSQLLNFSERTEALRITEERKGLILNIQKLVKDGMTEIQNLLNSISDEPPESYDYILKCCRSVLNEIRLIVTNWRSLGRDEK